ncbi:MAG: repair protein RecO, partial [Pseudomonadota bacterium]
FSDSRYWVDLMTEHQGRVSLLWRKTKKTPPLIPFTPYQATWSTRGQQKILTTCEPLNGPASLEGSALFCGFYVNELCERLLLLDEEAPATFNAYENTINALAGSSGLEQPLRYFEWQLICHLGFEFSFTQEGFGGAPICNNAWYCFNAHSGFERVGTQPIVDAFYGDDLLAIAEGKKSEALARVLKKLFRRALAHKLGAKPLKSREYFS